MAKLAKPNYMLCGEELGRMSVEWKLVEQQGCTKKINNQLQKIEALHLGQCLRYICPIDILG